MPPTLNAVLNRWFYLLLSLLLAACTTAVPPEPTPPPPTPTTLNTAVPAPTQTAMLEPSPTNTATAVPSPIPTATATTEPSPTPTPITQGRITAVEDRGLVNTEAINSQTILFYPPETHLPAQYSVHEYFIRFTSQDENGAEIELGAQLFVPQLETAADLPLFVFGAGTSGLVDACAPSRETSAAPIGDYRTFMLSYAGQGYISILPDYAGFNNPDALQAYYVSAMEGRALLDGARAARNFFAQPAAEDLTATPADTIFLAGYSQGGHAIFGATDIAATYAPELPLTGVLGFGATPNLLAHVQQNPYIAPVRFYGWGEYYGDQFPFDISTIIRPLYADNVAQIATQRCIGDIFLYYANEADRVYQPDFLEALYGGNLATEFPTVYEIVQRNSPGDVPTEIPALLLQGLNDTIVTPDQQAEFISRFCGAGNSLTYLTYEGLGHLAYEGLGHLATRQQTYPDALAWMSALQAGETPPDVCPTWPLDE